MKNKNEEKPKRYERLQGAAWDVVKEDMRLLYTYESDKGNIKGIYTDGKNRYSHWLNEDEKAFYKQTQKEAK
jgi:hypothetical protein